MGNTRRCGLSLASNLRAGWTGHVILSATPSRPRPQVLERLGSYQHSYPMHADALARIRGNVRRAFATSVYVALLERILLRRLLCFEFTSHYQADHVIRHWIRRGGRSGLPYDIDYLNALVSGEIGVPGSDFHHTDTGAKLLAVIWTIFLGDRGRRESE